MIIGIDLHNIRDGGGANYVRNLLENADQALDGFERIHLYGSGSMLATLPERSWITKHARVELEGRLPARLWFVWRKLPALLRLAGCDVLYAPGGVAFGNFRPYATISRNMLPFRPEFWDMYPRGSVERARLRILRRLNTASFARADGLIFLSETARGVISRLLPRQPAHVAIIPHGVDHARFIGHERTRASEATDEIAVVYPSRLEPYKHQLEVITAFMQLLREFPQASLKMIGQSNPSYLQAIMDKLRVVDPGGGRIEYVGEVPNAALPGIYAESQMLIFASSCENLPNILVEAMACGIPICCSNRSPMPEVARDACLYFDPSRPESILNCMRETLRGGAAALRRSRAGMAYAKEHSWQTTARRTFALIVAAATARSAPTGA